LVSAARRRSIALWSLRAGARLGITGLLAGLFLFGANDALQNAAAEGDTRTISFHHLHTDETIAITYKRNGRYDEAALKKLDWFMRDWRREEETHMDPHLFDLLWEADREVGGKEPIQVVCGYRSPDTNAMLRARSTGVAQFSQHTNGQAIDFYIPGVPLAEIRAVGLRLQRGGVGFYPTSGSPFVHLDTGTIRHWPRIAREELVKIFPDGRTVHIPADGQPLPGYKLALADVERHGAVPSETSLEAAREAGVITASDEERAAQAPKRSLLARLFSPGKDENEDREAPAAPKRPRASTVVASLSPPKQVATERIVPLPAARPRPAAIAAAAPQHADEPFVTASLGGNWRGTVEAGPALPPPPPIAADTVFETASADPANTALAFAAETPMPTPAPARVRPMGSNLPRLPAGASVMQASARTAAVVKSALAPAISGGGANYDSPWLRAAMLTPSVSTFMTASRVGDFDPRAFQSLLQKPPMSLVMTFSADPHYGMVADRFSGHAVVFLATASYTTQTASLR
jgi:uncharacterized protein YcbK (DUF882 family)